ncbi:MAG: substrate-binding periplasmic protein, partial [Deefgea sp.]
NIERFPWKRCVNMGAAGMADIVVNVPTAQIDPKPFLISEPFAQMHSVFYTTKNRFPKNFTIKDLEELKSYAVCGMLGDEYDSYGIQTQFVDTGAKTLAALINKTELGRCDLFIEKREVMAARAANDPELKKSILRFVERPLPEEEPLGLHFAISRRTPNAAALLAQINRSIAELKKTGQIARWQANYLGEALPKTSTTPPTKTK